MDDNNLNSSLIDHRTSILELEKEIEKELKGKNILKKEF